MAGLGVVLAIVAAACGSPAPAPPAADIEVFGGWRGDGADAFRQTLAAFTAETGITVRYNGTSDIIGDLEERVSQADAPDVAILPRPGVIQDLFRSGYVIALPEDVTEIVAANYRPDAVGITAVDGITNSVMIRVSVKDLVWYRPDHFTEQLAKVLQHFNRIRCSLE